ncbi:hypothetical protein Hanom_Chr04g00383591 [Helianthus anomalus]
MCLLFTSKSSKDALRSLRNLRINARNFLCFGCRLKYSNIQYRKLLLNSFFAILAFMFTDAAIPSICPDVNGRTSPLRKAFT